MIKELKQVIADAKAVTEQTSETIQQLKNNGFQRDNFITIEQTVAKQVRSMLEFSIARTLQSRFVLRETNNGTVDRGRLYPLRCARKRAKRKRKHQVSAKK